MLHNFLQLLLHYSSGLIPAFLFALLISAILAEIIPESFFEKVLSSNNFISIFLSGAIGAFIPLCTCGMIPLANKFQKKGVSWLIVISFLTAGNACCMTTLLLTSMLLGPKFALYRYLFAVTYGVLTAYIFVLFFRPNISNKISDIEVCHDRSKWQKIFSEYISLILSFGPWILVSIIIASLISLFLKPDFVVHFAGGKNIFSPFLLAISGFPFYFCGGLDVPISKALLEKGASLGNILTFMVASPGVNLTSLLVYQKWLGVKNAVIYLVISFLVCGGLGVVVNSLQ